MKLLLLTTHFPNRLDPMRGRYNLQQAQALSRYCEVRAVAATQWFPVRVSSALGPDTPPRFEEIEGIPTWHPRYVLTPVVGRDTHALQMAAILLPFLARVRREYPFDVLWPVCAYPDAVAGALAARLFRVPMIEGVMGTDVNEKTRYPLRRRQILWALGKAHRVLAVSQALGDRLRELGLPDEKIMVRHNGVDRERFQPRDARETRRRLGLREDGKHVVFVGFMMPAKALHVLIQAAARLREGGEPVTTHLVGFGPLEGELRKLAASLGMEESVLFHGGREHHEVPEWMAAADVFCLPSIREGCPNVILEALSSGRPVVASRVGGIPELTSPENAILVPPEDPEALAAALREALARDWDAASVSASVAGFSWDSSARAIYEAARDALATREDPSRRPVPPPAGEPCDPA